MKNKILALLVMMILVAMSPAFAAFPVKHVSSVEKEQTINTLNKKTPVLGKAYDKASTAADNFKRAFHMRNTMSPAKHNGNTVGILSLVFGILGVVGVFVAGFGLLFSTAAIVLGAIGLSHHEQFSLAGLILGILGFILSLIVILVVVALFL
ncbi:MAG: hypothetical protein JWQ38_2083 [Flavipsychrobacter sp.]|nr:hypothetical protein [Flavipsychrobacter sp.]